VPVPGPQNGRYAAEPLSGLTTLKGHSQTIQGNAVDLKHTVSASTEVPILTPWLGKAPWISGGSPPKLRRQRRRRPSLSASTAPKCRSLDAAWLGRLQGPPRDDWVAQARALAAGG
jgi:NADH-quinone oxidoreductase subunit E